VRVARETAQVLSPRFALQLVAHNPFSPHRLPSGAWLFCAIGALSGLVGCAGKSERKFRDGEALEAREGASSDSGSNGNGSNHGSNGEGDHSGTGDDGHGEDDDPDEVSPPAPEDDDLPRRWEWDHSVDGTCARWNADNLQRGEGTWSGSVAECDPGAISEVGRENALRLLNLHRWLADLPPVTTSDQRNELAQACALLEDANWRESGLSHTPPDSWKCYSEEAADGAITSNISTGPGVVSVPAYLLEKGAEAAMGHRRIILSNELGPIGLGSTGPGGASCMQALPGKNDAARAWVAWPPPGVFPLAAYGEAPRSLSDTGWSIQSDYIDLSKAKVSVSSRGRALATDVSELDPSPGSESAIRIVPNGWTVRAGETYEVSVTGIKPAIEYAIEIVDCDS
jgi:hypothetical protein